MHEARAIAGKRLQSIGQGVTPKKPKLEMPSAALKLAAAMDRLNALRAEAARL
jgi:hypothetical protein